MCLSKILGMWQDPRRAAVWWPQRLLGWDSGYHKLFWLMTKVSFLPVTPLSQILILHSLGHIGEMYRLKFLPTQWDKNSELHKVEKKAWILYPLHAWIYNWNSYQLYYLKLLCPYKVKLYSIHIYLLFLKTCMRLNFRAHRLLFWSFYFVLFYIHLHVYLSSQSDCKPLKSSTMSSSFLCPTESNGSVTSGIELSFRFSCFPHWLYGLTTIDDNERITSNFLHTLSLSYCKCYYWVHSLQQYFIDYLTVNNIIVYQK